MLEGLSDQTFDLRFPANEVEQWASRYVPSSTEKNVAAITASAKNTGYLDKQQLYEIARWKSPRRAESVRDNNDKLVQDLTGFCLQASNEASRIVPLLSLSGIGWPTASVILHFIHPDPYPILDFRALWSLNCKVPPKYTFEFWTDYVAACRKLAGERHSMRELDGALWAFSKEDSRNKRSATSKAPRPAP